MTTRMHRESVTLDAMPAWSRPLRIPEPVEITHAEPPFAFAGETSSWNLPFTLSKDVPPGADLRLQLWGGRNNKGGFFELQTEDPNAAGYLSAALGDGTPVRVQATEPASAFTLDVPGGLRAGDRLTVRLGPGTRAHDGRLLNKFFILYLKDDGPGIPAWGGGSVWAPGSWERIVAACTLHILGGPLHHLRAYAPATVRPGAEFSLLIRPEDEFDNLSHERPGTPVISLDGRPLPAQISPVEDSTCLLARVSLPAEGVCRLSVSASGKEARGNPVACSADAQPVYWGMIHGHTEMSDGTGALHQYFHQLRHEVRLDFAAPGDHDHRWETPDEFWQTTCAAVKRCHAPGEFVTLLGYEWAKWRRNGDADRNVYYRGDDRPLYRSDDGEYPAPPDLFAALAEHGERAIVIPHHTGHGGNWCDFKDHGPAFERLVEIFQVRGSFECSEKDGNPAPEDQGPWQRHPPRPEGYVRRALALGWRVGFTAGGDDHDGHWGTERRFRAYKQGLMSVEAPEKTRAAIFDAMHARRVVATTGARMLLTYRLNGNPLGSELSSSACPELASRRTLDIECHGTAPVDRIDIIRGNTVVHSIPGEDREDIAATWEDTEPLDAIMLPPAQFCDHPFAFYYVRVLQQDGEVAWASPVWVDP